MRQRYLSLDFLRGLSIFGMVFSAIVPYGVLPAWMYHIQNPPPTHELNVAVTGISWVDIEFLSIAALLLICGVAMIPVENGITKVPCTISYCFSTCAICILLLIFSDYLCRYIPKSLFVRIFSSAGMNLMKATGFIRLYSAAYPEGYPVAGVIRAAVAVLFTMWTVSLLSRRKIFWKA